MHSRNIFHGVLGGLAGGAVFGIIISLTGMLTTIGQMFGFPSAVFGFTVHILISAAVGALFAVLFGETVTSRTTGLRLGFLYGGFWWLLGPLTVMPFLMGLEPSWSLAAAVQMLPFLIGHLIYGAILGWIYGAMATHDHRLPRAADHAA